MLYNRICMFRVNKSIEKVESKRREKVDMDLTLDVEDYKQKYIKIKTFVTVLTKLDKYIKCNYNITR